MIVSFSGRKNSGKSTLSKYLQSKGFIHISVATELKELVSKLYNIPIEYLYSQEYKERILDTPLIWDSFVSLKLSTLIGIDNVLNSAYKILNTYREALQYIGTEILRSYDVDFHVKSLKKYLDSDKQYVIDDVRFKNELLYLRENGAKLIFIFRPYYFDNYSNHQSEIDLNRTDFEFVLINNRDENHLLRRFKRLETVLFSKKKLRYTRDKILNLLVKNNYNIQRCANSIGCSSDKIVWWCSKYAIPISRNTYTINHDVFLYANDKSSYFAGLISADGCIKRVSKYNYVLELASDDKCLIDGFSKFLITDKLPYIRKRFNGKNGYLLTINSQFIIEDMKLWNVEPQKSRLNKIPDIIRDNNDLLNAWMVGLIDGDGSIYFSTRKLKTNKKSYNIVKTICIQFLASKEIIDFISCRYGHICHGIYQEKSIENLYSLVFSGKNAISIYKEIYKIKFGLKRKWDKFKECNENGVVKIFDKSLNNS